MAAVMAVMVKTALAMAGMVVAARVTVRHRAMATDDGNRGWRWQLVMATGDSNRRRAMATVDIDGWAMVTGDAEG